MDKLKKYKTDTMEFVAVYGKRIVGKTALINEFVKDKPVIYFSAINANTKDNLGILSKAIYILILMHLTNRFSRLLMKPLAK